MKCGEKAVSYSSIYQIDSGVMLPELPHKKHGNACQQSPLTLLCSSKLNNEELLTDFADSKSIMIANQNACTL